MKINTQKKELAKQLAGHVPEGAEIIGIIEDCPGWSQSVLIRHRTGGYTAQIYGVGRFINPHLVWPALKGIFRVYEGRWNPGGGVEGLNTGSHYVTASDADSAAREWWGENEHEDIDENHVIVATDDDGDSAHYYPGE